MSFCTHIKLIYSKKQRARDKLSVFHQGVRQNTPFQPSLIWLGTKIYSNRGFLWDQKGIRVRHYQEVGQVIRVLQKLIGKLLRTEGMCRNYESSEDEEEEIKSKFGLFFDSWSCVARCTGQHCAQESITSRKYQHAVHEGRLDSIAVSVFVNIGWVLQYSIRSQDPDS